MNRVLRFAALLLLSGCLVVVAGCATAIRGYREYWEVESTPSAATVSLSNGVRCTSPCRIKLPRKYPFAVEVCKSGFAVARSDVESVLSGTGVAMAVGGGLVGGGTDVALGAHRKLRPDPLRVELQTESPGCEQPTFPAVPEDGQTPEKHARAEERLRRDDRPLRYRNSHGRPSRKREQ